MSNRELCALGDVECYHGGLHSRRDTMDPPSMDNIGSKEIRQLREQSSAVRTKAQTYQEELASARETVTALQSQLQTAKLEAEVDKL